MGAVLHEAQRLHRTADLLDTQAQCRMVSDVTENVRRRVELTALVVAGLAEVLADGLLLGIGRLERPVMFLQHFLLRLGEVVTESLPVEGVGLRVDTGRTALLWAR